MASVTSSEAGQHGPKFDIEKGSAADQPTAPPNDPEPEYPSAKKAAVVMLAAGLAMFLVALDRLIIATAIPRITDDFHSLDDIGWYASAYLITASATQLLWGRVYTFYSSKAVFLSAVGLFELGSVLCGAAPNSKAFIVGRAIAGMGSAGVFSGSMIVITHVLPLHKRPLVVGMMGAIFGISSIIGPLLGGLFTDNVSWRWCFYINLPIGAVTVVTLIWTLHLPPVKTSLSMKETITRLDPFGTAIFLPGVICFLLALQWGGATYPWDDARIIALFVLSGVLLIAFVGIQIWQQENATIPPRIMKNRSIACGFVYLSFVAGGMITMVYFLPFWFQAIKGVSAVRSGIDTLALVMAMVFCVIVSGGIISRMGYYTPFMIVGPFFLSVGAGLITTFKPDTSSSKWIGYQIIFGMGLGTGMQQANMAAQAVLSKKDVPTGIALMFFAQSLGGAVFDNIGEAIFTNHLVKGLGQISGINAADIVNAGATEIRNIVAPDKLAEVLVIYNGALVKAFTVSLVLVCIAIIPACGMEWKNIKGLQTGGPTEDKSTDEVPKATEST